MRVISINANRRLKQFVADLPPSDLLLVQEWASHQQDRSSEASSHVDMEHVHATRYLLVASAFPFEVLLAEERVMVINAGGHTIVNVYLPADGGRPREALLHHLRDVVLPAYGPVDLVAGDFNLAPRPEDGWHGPEPSSWNAKYERVAFDDLCSSHVLLDLGADAPWAPTFERMNKDKMTSFRCDLALAPSGSYVLKEYLHEFRRSKKTDHSGLLLER